MVVMSLAGCCPLGCLMDTRKNVISIRVRRCNALYRDTEKCIPKEGWKYALKIAVSAASAAVLLCGTISQARQEGVNKPELLPRDFTPVIDLAGFLSDGQERRIIQQVSDLEEETGFKLRVLAQNYPNTPGLAIKEFWHVDDSTIVFVADPSLGNILNFNVGSSVDLSVPRSFWGRLAGEYGNRFYWREKGEDASIEAAISAISNCLRNTASPRACSTITT